MKRFLALSAFVTMCAIGAPAATQTQTQICDEEAMTACSNECKRRPLNNDERMGCIVGCAIATGCP